MATGQWYHIVGVFNSATDRKLYVNGDQHGANTSSVTFVTTNQQVRVGRYVGTNTNYFSGYIDDVRIYNKTLTKQEIQTMYTARAPIHTIQYLNVGEFTINNDAPTSYTTGVILYSNVT